MVGVARAGRPGERRLDRARAPRASVQRDLGLDPAARGAPHARAAEDGRAPAEAPVAVAPRALDARAVTLEAVDLGVTAARPPPTPIAVLAGASRGAHPPCRDDTSARVPAVSFLFPSSTITFEAALRDLAQRQPQGPRARGARARGRHRGDREATRDRGARSRARGRSPRGARWRRAARSASSASRPRSRSW